MPILSARGGASAGAYGWGALSASSTAFDSIATWLSGNGTSQAITFSSIPQTYSHLQLRCFFQTTTEGQSPVLRANGDSGANYTRAFFRSNSSSTSSNNSTGTTFMANLFPNGTQVSNLPNIAIIDIYDYSSTTKWKTAKNYNFNQKKSTGTSMFVYESGLWMSNSAITSLSFDAYPYTNETVVALYGIRG